MPAKHLKNVWQAKMGKNFNYLIEYQVFLCLVQK